MDFPVSFVAAFKMLKYLRGLNQQQKQKEGAAWFCVTRCWTTLTHMLLGTWDELKYITNLQKDK